MTTGPLQGNMQSYVYDSRNRLQSAGGVSYGYNAENMRTSVMTDGNTIRYVINPNAALSQVLMETDADGNPLAYYVYGLGLLGQEDASGAYQSYHYDRRGSTVAMTALEVRLRIRMNTVHMESRSDTRAQRSSRSAIMDVTES